MSHCTTFAEAGRLVDAGRRAPFLLTLCEEDETSCTSPSAALKRSQMHRLRPQEMPPSTTFSRTVRRCAPMKTPRSSSSLKITCSIRCATNPTAYLTQTKSTAAPIFARSNGPNCSTIFPVPLMSILYPMERTLPHRGSTTAFTRRIRSSTSLPRPSPRCARPFDVHAHILCQQMFYSIRHSKRKSPCLVTRAF